MSQYEVVGTDEGSDTLNVQGTLRAVGEKVELTDEDAKLDAQGLLERGVLKLVETSAGAGGEITGSGEAKPEPTPENAGAEAVETSEQGAETAESAETDATQATGAETAQQQ